ncbi:MAG: hypothetical protein CVU07_07145 [Bacteroidetes bacterium HGW-Bacteroidetes-23]|nr:MAG: hypothetical protein CVU07_07145 [Bacteroidetes bacterium HGW-Bacteroidetes-23]
MVLQQNLLSNLKCNIMKSISKNAPLHNLKTVFFSLLFVSFFSFFVSCTTDESDELIYNSITEEVEVLASEVEGQPNTNTSTPPPKKN